MNIRKKHDYNMTWFMMTTNKGEAVKATDPTKAATTTTAMMDLKPTV